MKKNYVASVESVTNVIEDNSNTLELVESAKTALIDIQTPSAQMVETTNKVAEMLNPSAIKNAIDANVFIDFASALANISEMSKCRAIYLTKKLKLWKDDKDASGKPFDKFIDWAESRIAIGSSSAYAKAAIGELISEDGLTTTLPRYTKRDYTYSAVLKMIECKYAYKLDGSKVVKKDGEKVKLMVCDEIAKFIEEITTDESGNEIVTKTRVWEKCEGEIWIVELLCKKGILTPLTKRESIQKIIEEYVTGKTTADSESKPDNATTDGESKPDNATTDGESKLDNATTDGESKSENVETWGGMDIPESVTITLTREQYKRLLSELNGSNLAVTIVNMVAESLKQ